jgi:3-methyladenine DNA glycosylase AlkD
MATIKKAAPAKLTAKQFIEDLKKFQSDAEAEKLQRYFKTSEGDVFMGVKMGQLFELAKQYAEMPIAEIEKLLESKIHEVRAGGVSIMDKASRSKKLPEERRKDFYELYMRRHDHIDNWDLVDLGCLYMTGSYLYDKPRQPLYKLAKSKNQWERRTAVLSTCYFIRQGDLDDTYKISEMLLKDKEDLVHKAAGWMLRFAGDKDKKRLLAFLDENATTMPRTMLRNAIEKFEPKQREHYLKLK